jgi:hypothetical protein
VFVSMYFQPLGLFSVGPFCRPVAGSLQLAPWSDAGRSGCLLFSCSVSMLRCDALGGAFVIYIRLKVDILRVVSGV